MTRAPPVAKCGTQLQGQRGLRDGKNCMFFLLFTTQVGIWYVAGCCFSAWKIVQTCIHANLHILHWEKCDYSNYTKRRRTLDKNKVSPCLPLCTSSKWMIKRWRSVTMSINKRYSLCKWRVSVEFKCFKRLLCQSVWITWPKLHLYVLSLA